MHGFNGGERIIVRQDTGHQDDFMIVQAGGQPKVKRVVQKLSFDVSPSPAVAATSRVVHDLADVDAATEKRALEIYQKFGK